MISGPVYPRNRESLWEIVQRYLERIESGLQWIARDVHFDEGCSLEGLACDAGGRPVLFVVHVPDEMDGGDLVRRVVAARVAFRRSRGVLADLLPHGAVDYLRPPRVLVVCREMDANARECLLTLGVPDLEAFQVRAIRVGGDLRIGITPLLGGARRQRRVDFDVPPGFSALDCGLKEHVAKFMQLVRRVDPGVRAAGDRYARSVLLADAVVARVRLRDQLPVVEIPDRDMLSEAVVALDNEAAVQKAVDRALRRCLTIHDELAAREEEGVSDVDGAPSIRDPLVGGGGSVDLADAAPSSIGSALAPIESANGVQAVPSDSPGSGPVVRSPDREFSDRPARPLPRAGLRVEPPSDPDRIREGCVGQNRVEQNRVEPEQAIEPADAPAPAPAPDLASVRDAIARTGRGDDP